MTLGPFGVPVGVTVVAGGEDCGAVDVSILHRLGEGFGIEICRDLANEGRGVVVDVNGAFRKKVIGGPWLFINTC